MITINLLGDTRGLGRDELLFLLRWGLMAIAATLLILFAYALSGLRLARAQVEVSQIEHDLHALRSSNRGANRLPQEYAAAMSQLEVIASVHRNRRAPVLMLDSLNTALPEAVWLTHIKEKSGSVLISGFAAENQMIADFITGLERSAVYAAVELVESKIAPYDGRNLRQFSIHATIRSGDAIPLEGSSGQETAEHAKLVNGRRR